MVKGVEDRLDWREGVAECNDNGVLASTAVWRMDYGCFGHWGAVPWREITWLTGSRTEIFVARASHVISRSMTFIVRTPKVWIELMSLIFLPFIILTKCLFDNFFLKELLLLLVLRLLVLSIKSLVITCQKYKIFLIESCYFSNN